MLTIENVKIQINITVITTQNHNHTKLYQVFIGLYF